MRQVDLQHKRGESGRVHSRHQLRFAAEASALLFVGLVFSACGWYSLPNSIVFCLLLFLIARRLRLRRDFGDPRALKRRSPNEELSSLVREVHDGLGASLSRIAIQSEYLLGLTKNSELSSEVRELRASAEEAIDELRRNLRMMRNDFDFRESFQDYLSAFRRRTRLNVSFQELGIPGRLPHAMQLSIFRVLQEALSNCAKHARAAQIKVKFLYGDEEVLLSVEDDGVGIDAAKLDRSRYGLQNMRDRARELGGHFLVETNRGLGSIISFSAPIRSS
jgi:signal transduction histidine kinase